MIVLTTTASQTLKVIPREYLGSFTIDVRDSRDRIFVTDQDIDQLNDNDHYNINKDQYTTNNSYDNEYIVI
jgi:hypothetical protein